MRTNPYYQVYQQEVLDFTRTLVVKSSGVATTLNNELTAIGVPVPNDPRDWKYYKNLAGEYFETDTEMRVRSMDTLDDIAFTKANMKIHRATFREYQYGTRYYKDLTRRYPNQVMLINGILAPVDKDAAIDAVDGQLLQYDTRLMADNEARLIERLQTWLYAFFNRWYNEQYGLSDDLYIASFLGVLYANLPYVIQLLRLRHVKTPYVHPFHIREYFASNGQLDKYLYHLNQHQQLYLYRNLRYLNRNVGKQRVFETLTQELLTERGLPLAAYNLQHNPTLMPASLYPDVELRKTPLNFGYNQSGLDTASVHTILNEQRPLARENADVQNEAEQQITETMQSSAYSELPTKVLESEVVDRTNASVRSLGSVLLYEWLYLSTHDRYTAFVTVPNNATGETMTLSVRDAFIVGLWAFNKARGIEFDTIPRVIAYEVLRDPLPRREELLGVVDQSYIPDGMIDAIRDRIDPLSTYITTERFYNDCSRLHQQSLALWELYSYQEHYLTRGLLEQVVKRHFMHIQCDLVDEVISFEQWFKEKGLFFDGLSSFDLEQLYIDCAKVATGQNLVNRRTLAELQKAMLELMGRMSSYTVHYLRNINDDDFWFIGFPAIRLGDLSAHEYPNWRVLLSHLNVMDKTAAFSETVETHALMAEPPVTWDMHTQTPVCIDATVGVRQHHRSLGYVRINVADVGVRSLTLTHHTTPPTDNDLGHYRYPGDDDDWPTLT